MTDTAHHIIVSQKAMCNNTINYVKIPQTRTVCEHAKTQNVLTREHRILTVLHRRRVEVLILWNTVV